MMKGEVYANVGSAEYASEMVERSDLLALPVLEGDAPILVAAPIGFGKTCFARQFSRRHHPVLWIDCSLERLTTSAIGLRIERWMEGFTDSQGHAGDDGPLVVLEEIDLIEGVGGSEEFILSITSMLAHPPRIFATTATVEGQGRTGQSRPRELIYLLHDDLRLAPQQTPRFAAALGTRVASVDDSDRLFRRTLGIPALVALAAGRDGRGGDFDSSVAELIASWVGTDGVDADAVACVLAALLLGGGRVWEITAVAGVEHDCVQLLRSVPFIALDDEAVSATTFDLSPSMVARIFKSFPRSQDVFSRAGSALARIGKVIESGEVMLHGSRSSDLVGWLELWGEALVARGAVLLHQQLEERVRIAGLVPSGPMLFGSAVGGWVVEGAHRAADLLESAVRLMDLDEPLARRSMGTLLMSLISRGDHLRIRRHLGRSTVKRPYSESLWFESDDELYLEAAGVFIGSVPLDGEVCPVRFRALASGGNPVEVPALMQMARLVDGGWSSVAEALNPSSVEEAVLEAEGALDALMRGDREVATVRLGRAEKLLALPGFESIRTVYGVVDGAILALDGDASGLERIRAAGEAASARGESWMAHGLKLIESSARLALGDVRGSRDVAGQVVAYFRMQPWTLPLAVAETQLAAAIAHEDRPSALAMIDRIRSEWSDRYLPEYLKSFMDAVALVAAGFNGSGTQGPERSGYLKRAFDLSLTNAPRTADARKPALTSRYPETEFETDRPGAIRVNLFGRFEVTDGAHTLAEPAWAKRKSRLLLAAMVIRRGRDLPRETLYQRLWPSMRGKQARDNFYVTWSNLRRALAVFGDPHAFISNSGGVCRIDPARVTSDVEEFDRLQETILALDRATATKEILDGYMRLAKIYGGPLLAGELYDDWFMLERNSYHDRFIESMTIASGIAQASGNAALGLWFARLALEADGSREESYLAMMRAQRDANQRSSALETFYRCKDYLANELGLDPSEDTMALYQELLVMESRPHYGSGAEGGC